MRLQAVRTAARLPRALALLAARGPRVGGVARYVVVKRLDVLA